VDPVAGGDVGGEFTVAAAEVLDEAVPGGQDARGPVALQAAIGCSRAFSRPRSVSAGLFAWQLSEPRASTIVSDPFATINQRNTAAGAVDHGHIRPVP
jgi:hypothetical protein